jgi:hypothetical protein
VLLSATLLNQVVFIFVQYLNRCSREENTVYFWLYLSDNYFFECLVIHSITKKVAMRSIGPGVSIRPHSHINSNISTPTSPYFYQLILTKSLMVGSLKKNTTLEYSTRVVQEGDRRCEKSTLNDLAYLTPLRIPLMNPVLVLDFSCLVDWPLHWSLPPVRKVSFSLQLPLGRMAWSGKWR